MAIPNSATDHSSNRTLTGMAYDITNTKIVVFGGKKVDGTSFSDTWTITDAGSWTQANPAASPTPRYAHAMAYSHDDGYTLVFGGKDDSENVMYSDTWFWNNTTWQKFSSLTPYTTEPSQRFAASMVSFDGYNNVMLFGGIGSTLINRYEYLSDSWLFSTTTKTWSVITSANNPPDRAYTGIAFDGYNAYVGFGEQDGQFLQDLWKINALGKQWNAVSLSGTKPSARKGAAMCWDGHNNNIFVFGGYSVSLGLSNETFTISSAGVCSLLSTPTHPTRRFNASAVYDSGTGKITLFGGTGLDGAPLGDQWIFDCTAKTWSGTGDFIIQQTTGPVSDH